MKTFKVFYNLITKGTENEGTIVVADKFIVQKEKGYRFVAFYKDNEIVAMFTADKIVAIY